MTPSQAVWQPYEDEPLFVPEVLLGFEALEPTDAKRLTLHLGELVARRGVVHTAIAFNAIYFGYDLDFGGYVGGAVEFDRFPQVTFGQTTAALPVGAMVNVATGASPIYAEVVYKEGAHPALVNNGDVPAWLSGAPASVGETDQAAVPVLAERLVIDTDAFGRDLVATPAQLDRLRRRGKWLDANGHLLLDARYDGADDAEADDTEYYARYLLTRGRDQLLAGPLPLFLSDDAGEEHLAAALRAALRTVADALAAIEALRSWRGYFFTRASLSQRLAGRGALGRDDLIVLAGEMSHAGPSSPRRFMTPPTAVRYTAVGPRLRAVSDAAPQLLRLGYPAAVCHANTVIGDYASREPSEDGVLPSGSHLRLDDAWQGGGIWRASNPPGPYAALDPRNPLGLGWSETRPGQAAPDALQDATEVGEDGKVEVIVPFDDLDSGIRLLSVADSQVSWTATLRLKHVLTGTCALPDRIVEPLRAAGLMGSKVRLSLSHPTRDGSQLDPGEAVQDVDVTLAGQRARLTEVEWPLEFFPGIVLTFSWTRGAAVLRAHSTLLDAPVIVEGEEYEHQYDPSVLTRDTAPGAALPDGADHGPLSLRQRVLRAVRRAGQLAPDGSAILRRDMVGYLVYGTQASAADAALAPVIDALIAERILTVEHTTLGPHGLDWPPSQQGEQVPVLVWRPRIVQGGQQRSHDPQPDLASYVVEYSVASFLRKLPPGQQASPDKLEQYRKLMARYGRNAELPSGYTLVDGHARHR